MTSQLSRKDFLRGAAALIGAGMAAGACSSSSSGSGGPDSGATGDGGSDSGSDTGAQDSAAMDTGTTEGGASTCPTNGAKDNGINDPKHHLVVPAADVVAAVAKTYSIQGTQTHDHMVTLQPADFATLAVNGSMKVTVTSTTTAMHSHTFDVVCA